MIVQHQLRHAKFFANAERIERGQWCYAPKMKRQNSNIWCSNTNVEVFYSMSSFLNIVFSPLFMTSYSGNFRLPKE